MYVGWIGWKSASASKGRRAGGGGPTNKKSSCRRDGRRDASPLKYRGNGRETTNDLIWWVLGCPEERGGNLRRRNGGPGVGDGTDGDDDIEEEQEGEGEEQEGGGRGRGWDEEEEEKEKERGWLEFLWSTLSRGARDERRVVSENRRLSCQGVPGCALP
ncbi:hypothetical protein BDW42DRAFT_128291 [Aspergillus taichungensis]|uniref:Uncharacterized protein n=1 Tax=Aspergillus taichungensis TaxID=482145 RepID=A0A2J5HQB8_9EURO|nr:hypothetical protein BDW42DRAFT_128291 [Aspergillus taichungensis]